MSEANLDELNESIKLLRSYRNRLEKEVSSIARKLQMPQARINSTLKENRELIEVNQILTNLMSQREQRNGNRNLENQS